jgi:hypothetical protein
MGRGVFAPTPYKEVTLKCTQATTGAPAIAYTLGNTFGEDIVTTAITPARTTTGLYTFTWTGLFTAAKTVAFITANAATRVWYVVYTSADVLTLHFLDAATPTVADSGNFDLTIRVYD